MKQKKAQIQLGESIFVVIIIIMLIIFGIVFFSKAESNSIKGDSRVFGELSVIAATQYAGALTELQCSLQEVAVATCFDKIKLDSFEKLIKTTGSSNGIENVAKEFYFSQLGNAKIIITQTYPYTTNTVGDPEFKSWKVYENFPAGESGDGSTLSQKKAILPISILNPVQETYSFGIMELTIYT